MTKDELFLAARIPMLGAISSSVRAVAIKWDETAKSLLLRYYFSSPPLSEDAEMASEALGEIVSSFWREIESANYECIYTADPIAALDTLDGWLFLRREVGTSGRD